MKNFSIFFSSKQNFDLFFPRAQSLRWWLIKQSQLKKKIKAADPPIAQLVERRTLEKLISWSPWIAPGSVVSIAISNSLLKKLRFLQPGSKFSCIRNIKKKTASNYFCQKSLRVVKNSLKTIQNCIGWTAFSKTNNLPINQNCWQQLKKFRQFIGLTICKKVQAIKYHLKHFIHQKIWLIVNRCGWF